MSISSRNGGNASETKTGDRRVHERRAIAPRLYVILHGSNCDGILNDVSEGGAALDIVGSKPDSEYLLVDFEMSETGQRLEATGRITWRDGIRNKVGIHFVDLPEVSRSHIREWLAKKSASAEPVQSAIVQDAEREGSLPLQRSQRAVSPSEQKVEARGEPTGELEIEAQREPTQQIEVETSRGPQVEAARGWPTPRPNDRLVQSLIESFNKPQKKPKVANLISKGQGFFSGLRLRRWILVGSAICLAVLLAFGVTAHRSPQRNAGTINVSKAGQRPNAVPEGASPKAGENRGGSGSSGNAGNGSAGGGDHGGGAGDSPETPGNSQLPPSALLSSLAAALPKGSRPPCVNLSPSSDRIRIYLWAEKGTPDAIVATYAKYLKAISDLRVVDKAPYDLVLYVNGANVGTKGPEAGFIWSSRVFRPWYCGQTLGLLEQTQVNESLHYVQDANLNLHIQTEVAYLILHTFESIRNEHAK